MPAISEQEGASTMWALSGFVVAIKVVQAKSEAQFKQFTEEVRLLQTLTESRYVVEIFDAELQESLRSLAVVMEIGDCDFANWLESRRGPNQFAQSQVGDSGVNTEAALSAAPQPRWSLFGHTGSG